MTTDTSNTSVHEIGARVMLRHDPRIWDDESIPHGITGTVVETMAVGTDVRVEWDDGQRRGRYDGWVSWTSIERADAAGRRTR